MTTSQTLRTAAGRLQEAIGAEPQPAPDPNKLRRLTAIAASLQGVDQASFDAASELVSYARRLYSERAHENFPGGAEELRSRMRGRIESVLSMASRYEALGR